MEIVRIVAHAGPLGWLTLIILLIMSVMSWGIIFHKSRFFSKISKNSRLFLEKFWQSRNLEHLYTEAKGLTWSPPAHVFQAGYVELVKLSKRMHTEIPSSPVEEKSETAFTIDMENIDNLERALRRSASHEVSRSEKYVSFLATTGATAPFIGLFGTVIGIMRSFHQIGRAQSVSIADVAPGISEALLATAAGLAAAIPAVIAYNHFHSKIKKLATEMENFSADYLNILKRRFFK